ncbi:trihelix transcription factor ENAP1 isoform X2 [Vitis vinifera]|uniref:trihelix transcription factor ENAP1 isoform X2 n=1 Tax=Vitis vinifera TaxID=29760 RepID=UPI00053FC287|nr:trihelix transcription factor ENAP1 isoform X2 [Vitis vinifera]|eukprot:XP_010655523.1 PREDICTED: trihelix transcription factor ASIL1 isoform X2 [Vitis vinifera]
MGDLTDSLPPSTAPQRSAPFREDCWSEDATSTLVDAWGRRYIELNRGNLRQKDWQEVADAVNARHGHVKKARRTDVQCKNRIDTIKKKYKIEKARVTTSNGALTSSWPFFSRLDALIGPTLSAKKPSSASPPLALPLPYWKTPSPAAPSASVGALPQKRPMPAVDDSYFRRNYSAVAAAAAAEAVDEDEDEEEEEEESRWSAERSGDVDGMRQLARAIERFGEIYEKVEAEKQKQMFELEKQRMQFAKDVEFQRMKMFMDTQVQLEKIKRAKRSGLNGFFSLNGDGVRRTSRLSIECLG